MLIAQMTGRRDDFWRLPWLPVILILLTAALSAPTQCHGQVVLDTLFNWSGYLSDGQTKVTAYQTLPGARKKAVVVLRELAENRGRSIIVEARFLADAVSNILDIPASDLIWIFHWGSFSYEGARNSRKDLFLKASFKLTNGRLSPPQWRVVDEDAILEYTDRQYRRR